MPLVADVIEPSDVHTIARALRPARRQRLFKSVGRVEVIGNEAGWRSASWGRSQHAAHKDHHHGSPGGAGCPAIVLAASVVEVASGRRRAGLRSRRCRVLVVEDDDAFAEALTELLEADGRVELAGRARDGREGVELAHALRPDVVLMDIALPVMDGVEATREIRRRHPAMVVVAITGWEYEERALEVREAGAADYVRKDRLDPDLVTVLLAARHSRSTSRIRRRPK